MNLDLQTERLSLQPLAASDLNLALEVFTDEEIMKYIGNVLTKGEIAEAMEIETKRGGGGCIGVWCISHRTTGEKVGSVFLLPLPIEEDDTDWNLVVENQLPDCDIEIGYILKRPAWGNGYATEAAERLLRFAFEETPLEEIVGVIDPENEASRRVLKKLGLLDEGLRRAYGGQCPGFRITRQQWLDKASRNRPN
ncbi:MAG: GNAT family N-acetyltransferase [Acidiferrobacterales bacterium]